MKCLIISKFLITIIFSAPCFNFRCILLFLNILARTVPVLNFPNSFLQILKGCEMQPFCFSYLVGVPNLPTSLVNLIIGAWKARKLSTSNNYSYCTLIVAHLFTFVKYFFVFYKLIICTISYFP